MMNVKIYKREDANITYKQIIDLIHESFQERLDQGLRYSCSFMTEEQYKERVKNGIILVAIDNDSNKLAGTLALNKYLDNGEIHGYTEYLAVSNNYKHYGIGSLLMHEMRKVAKREGCFYILSDTSTKANSAVKYHVKNGFKIIGLESYRSTNYWSYVFRMQLKPSFIWNNFIFLRLHYIVSYIFIKSTRNIDGTDTYIGKLYKRLRNICKN